MEPPRKETTKDDLCLSVSLGSKGDKESKSTATVFEEERETRVSWSKNFQRFYLRLESTKGRGLLHELSFSFSLFFSLFFLFF
jgi:hypothetical protein